MEMQDLGISTYPKCNYSKNIQMRFRALTTSGEREGDFSGFLYSHLSCQDETSQTHLVMALG